MRYMLVSAALAVLSGAGTSADTLKPGNVTFVDGEVFASLTGQAGDAVAGRSVFMNRKQGNCLACHSNSDMSEQAFHGEVGPSLDGAADRWSEAAVRGIVSNSKNMFEGTIMPAFYADSGFERPLGKFEGKSILTAQEVEDVVAYVLTLKE